MPEPYRYRQKRARELTPEQLQMKIERDKEYEAASEALATPFYQKKHSVGVTQEEENAYEGAYHALWDDYVAWAVANGLMEEITPQMQLTEATARLNVLLEEANTLREGLGLPPLKVV